MKVYIILISRRNADGHINEIAYDSREKATRHLDRDGFIVDNAGLAFHNGGDEAWIKEITVK